MLKRLGDLEKQREADRAEIKELREQNLKLHVANIEIRQVLYGQMTLEEWDQKSKNKDKRKKSFDEGSKEG